MDIIDRKIVDLLSADSRRSLADIGSVVGLSPSSVNDRIRRLVTSGVIRRFTVEADPAALDLATLAFVLVALREDANEEAFRRFASQHAQIMECHHVTGGWSYMIKLRVGTTADLEVFLSELKQARFLGRSETVIALSSPVEGGLVLKGVP